MMARAKAKTGVKVGAKGVKTGTEKELIRPGKLQSVEASIRDWTCSGPVA